MYLPSIIQDNAAAIRNLNVDEQDVHFNRDSWQRRIPDFDDIIENLSGDTISRQQIFDRFTGISPRLATCDLTLQTELRRLFVWAMLWGYGLRGYGPFRVARMLDTPNLDQILCQSSEECYYGMFLMAYDSLNSGVKNLGPAFATKFLYFLSKSLTHAIKPLIFDSVVVATLRQFEWPDWVPNYLARGTTPLPTSRAYGQYLILLHNWASAIGCRPDQLEYFLWKRNMSR